MEHPSPIECDVLVIGSGASGMAAAIVARHHGLDVLVVEKASLFGGTTAVSGGWIWIPGNRLAAAQGIADDANAARTYLRGEAGAHYDSKRVEAFLSNGPRMVDFFARNTVVRFVCPPAAPDYHAESPGGVKAGRSLMIEPMDGRTLGAYRDRIRPPLPELTVLGMMLGSGRDVMHFMRATRSLTSAAYVARRLADHAFDVMRYGRGMSLSNGNALAGRLARSALDLGIPIWLSSPARELLATNGTINGARIEREGQLVDVRARRGVVLACGGFSHEIARRQALYPALSRDTASASPVPRENTGDGLRMAQAQGAIIEDSLAQPAAWVPVSVVPRSDGGTGPFPHFIDRAKPGVIAVTRKGRRFVDEARSYHEFVSTMANKLGEDDLPVFLVCDHRTIRRYGLGAVRPAPFPLARHLASKYLLSGSTLEALAKSAGIDADALAATVKRVNADAQQGRDSEFNKGSTPYGRHMGDGFHAPHPCIAPIEHPPYFAVRIVPADLGTYAGLKTDERTRVLGRNGQAVPGLYAVGNDMANVMGGGYPGAGAMLGAAMTFGFVAGCQLAGIEPGEQDALPG